jgi:hypothetical protein
MLGTPIEGKSNKEKQQEGDEHIMQPGMMQQRSSQNLVLTTAQKALEACATST